MTKNEFLQAKEFISDEKVLFFAERVMMAQEDVPASWKCRIIVRRYTPSKTVEKLTCHLSDNSGGVRRSTTCGSHVHLQDALPITHLRDLLS